MDRDRVRVRTGRGDRRRRLQSRRCRCVHRERFSVTVPADGLEDGQTIAVRIAPLLVTSLASAHTGYDVDVTGTLDFQVIA